MAPLDGLRVRKLADKTEERVERWHPITGAKLILRPETAASLSSISDFDGLRTEPWPLAGVTLVGDTPQRCRVSTSFVAQAIREGWMQAEGSGQVFRPSGSAETPWDNPNFPPHTFMHAETIIIKCIEGDVRYRVTHQPDKYVERNEYDDRGVLQKTVDTDDEPVTDEIYAAGETRVDHFYDLELEA